MRPSATVPIAIATLFLFLLPSRTFAACDVSGLPDGTKVVEFTLGNGAICLEMLEADAPINVANFLYYVASGEYDGSIFHRHVHDFVLQGGDQRRNGSGGFETIPKKDSEDVQNEPCTPDTPGTTPGVMVCSQRGNVRGTVAAAKLGGNPDSASTNFFINLGDNRENLDNQNGGFTVYARVMGSGMDHVDSLVATSSYRRQSIAGQLGSFASVSLMQTPGIGDYSGCYDPSGNVAAALNFPALTYKRDPRDPSSLFLLSTQCSATPVPDPQSFVASPCSGMITSSDELAVGIDPLSLELDPPGGSFFRHICSAVDQFLASVATARANSSYQADYAAQVVYIESATLTIVPEPTRATLASAAAWSLFGLRQIRRRQRRR